MQYSLDISAAFDTIDHDILITRLSTWYGISGTALSCFTSYLTDRRQAIKIGNCFSDMLPTSCGVPRVLFWALAFHSVYNTIKLCYTESQLGSSPLCRRYINLSFFDHTRHLSLPKPSQGLSPRCPFG